MKLAGVCAASIVDPAGGRVDALLQRLEVQAAPSPAITISPSITARGGKLRRTASTTSGK